MAGMEELEIHSKSYLVRWVTVKADHTISWIIQSHKKSINFGIFKRLGQHATLSPAPPSTSNFTPLTPNLAAADAAKDSSSGRNITAPLSERLAQLGLKEVSPLTKCEADKVSQGKYDVLVTEGGNYALVFDNEFSKTLSKTATFVLLTYPTAHPPQFGAQLHHSQAASTTTSSQLSKVRPALQSTAKDSADSLKQPSSHLPVSATDLLTTSADPEPSINEPESVHTGILQKRRRKRHQGYARRFFSLDFASSTLSYYHDRNSSPLRGAIPLSLAAIGANASKREISIDSGAEIWHLKANNAADFEAWKSAFQKASTMPTEYSTSPMESLDRTDSPTIRGGNFSGDREWVRVESLVARISAMRDAMRVLCRETGRHGFDSGPPTPTDASSEDYFKLEDKERRPSFWKRKPSSTSAPSTLFRRSVSAQLAVATPNVDQTMRNGVVKTPGSASMPPKSRYSNLHDEGIHEQCRVLLGDLDSVLAEFSSLILYMKQRRPTIPKSTLSRQSINSIESQEFFDAEDRTDSALLDIQGDSDDEQYQDGRELNADTDSISSSDFGGSDTFVAHGGTFQSDSVPSLFPSKSKSLVPLPVDPVRRRTTVTAPKVIPPSLIGFLRKNVGKDLSTISMPVSANEPTSLLQRASEQLEYSSLLDKASGATDALERLIYVTAFAISSLSNARVKERSIRKPFNPMLGETFELVREDRGFRFVAEKVSHRPVQLALHAESKEWSFAQSPLPSQKFWGKSSEIITEGKARLALYASSDCLSWSAANAFLRNIIAGEKYVEPVGTMTVLNETTGQKVVVTFKSGGMFSGRSEEVSAQAFDAHGDELPLGLQGTWTHSLKLTEHGHVTDKTIWTSGSLVDHAAKHYGMTSFAATLNEITPIEADHLPPTDSRLRPDQQALEHGDHEKAEQLKNELEERQRARRRDMEEKGDQWRPRWFSQVEVPGGDGEVVWKLKQGKEGYWEERANGTWPGVVNVLKL